MTVRCHSDIIKQLDDDGMPAVGYLIGYELNSVITVLSFVPCSESGDQFVSGADNVQILLPAGISVIGVFLKEENLDETVKKFTTTQLQSQLNLNELVIIQKVSGSDSVFFTQSNTGALTACKAAIVEEDLFSTFQILRLKTVIEVDITIPSSTMKAKNHIIQSFDGKVCEIESPSSSVVYHITNSPVLLPVSEVSGDCPSTCEDLPNCIITDHDQPEYLRNTKKKGQKKQTIEVSLLRHATGTNALNQTQTFSPVINYFSESFNNIRSSLPVDVVVLVDGGVKCDQLSTLLSQGISRQLRAMQNCLIAQINTKQISQFNTPRVYHFRPSNSQTLFSVVYPDEQSEEDLKNLRKGVHELLGYPLDRPLFRKANVFRFPEEIDVGGYLRNPHIGLPPSGVVDGKVYMVKGDYTYHHYMQDRFDDDKWGCAYRSLQTLVSWFILQGYSSCDIPTHRDIQQALVDVGDKEPKFVGSKQWIGSFEVSICLDQFLGVSSKFLSVSEGSELAYKGRELAMHFETQGTPVMIGGGVLAHTILGVDYNSETGDIKFLILDPHYTGAEDLKVIQNKGWCGWKGPDFWVSNAHYNLCMPQRNQEF